MGDGVRHIEGRLAVLNKKAQAPKTFCRGFTQMNGDSRQRTVIRSSSCFGFLNLRSSAQIRGKCPGFRPMHEPLPGAIILT
jgi:hypothetical protein